VQSLSLRAGDEPLEILCIGAHSDDIEIGCGGSLLRLLSEFPGTRVHWVVLSASDEREKEARASAEDFVRDAADATVRIQKFRESYFPYVGADIKDYFETLKASVRPNVVFAHHRHDEHQDHRTVAQLTWNSFRDHLILEYEIPKYEGDLGLPNLYVPLQAATAARKVELLMHHFASQRHRGWFQPQTFNGLMAVRGVECNAPEGAAEAFHVRKAVL
jgi:LmbE family N-acetylglucosaminyl deacetylase